MNIEPEFRTRRNMRQRAGSKVGWIVGAAVLLLLIGALVTWGPTSVNNASNISDATRPAETTGSGADQRAPASNVPPANTPTR